jgi:negative regulator of sigma-B (phosphoserine phosphatase)
MIDANESPILNYAVESITLPGQTESGDRYVVRKTSTGILIGLTDGLGHGAEAARASELAIRLIENSFEDSLITIAKRCHEQLQLTRGVVMALASINATDNTLTWFSIGNIEGVLIHSNPHAVPAREYIFTRPGVVGYRFPLPSATVLSIFENDLLVLATDGIRNDFATRITSSLHGTYRMVKSPAGTGAHWDNESQAQENSDSSTENLLNTMELDEIAKFICQNFSKKTDDALVFVARYKASRR